MDLYDLPLVKLLNSINLAQEFPFDFLLNFSADDLKVLLNTCYARHGRPFQSRRMRDIFQNTSWFMVNPYYTDALLTESDKENINKLRSIIVLTAADETLLYQVKRGKRYIPASFPESDFQIVIEKEKDSFQVEGKVPDPDNIWLKREFDAANNLLVVSREIPVTGYGPDGWFIYKDAFYFFIQETVEVNMFASYKVRRYLSCSLDYTDKSLYNLRPLAAMTEDF